MFSGKWDKILEFYSKFVSFDFIHNVHQTSGSHWSSIYMPEIIYLKLLRYMCKVYVKLIFWIFKNNIYWLWRFFLESENEMLEFYSNSTSFDFIHNVHKASAVPHPVFWYRLNGMGTQKMSPRSSCNTFSIAISHKN